MTSGRRWGLWMMAAFLFLTGCTLMPMATHSPAATPSAAPPSPTATTSPIPSPTPLPPLPLSERLAIAEEAYAFGDWERAEAAYRSMLGDAPEAMQPRVLLGLGKTLLAQGVLTEGLGRLSGILTLYPTSPLTSEVHLRLGDALLRNDAAEAAVSHYELVLRGPDGPILAPYAFEWKGDALYASAAYTEALGAYTAAARLAKDDRSRHVYLLEKMALTASAMGDERGTLSAYDDILAEARIPAYRARILYQSAQAAQLFGDMTEYLSRLRRLLDEYPDQHYGYLALAALVEAGQPVDDLLRGKVDYWGGAYSPAVQALYRYIDAHPDHNGEAHFYAARAFLAAGSPQLAAQEAEKLVETHPASDPWWDDGWIVLAEAKAAQGDAAGAQAAYRHLAEVLPQSPLAPSALWKAAELDERSGRFVEAADAFLDLADRYPADSGAPEALFRAGLDRYRAGAMADAVAGWRELLRRYPDSERGQAAYFWIGRAELRAGESVSGTQALQEAANWDRWSYYGIRATDWLEGRLPMSVEAGPLRSCEDEVDAVRAWIADWSGEAGAAWPPAAIGDDPRLRRGLLLLRVDHFDEGKAELEALRHATADDPLAQYALALAARDAGLYRTSILAALTVLRLSPAETVDEVPRALACLAYPIAYAPLVEEAASGNGFAPLQLYALIRQESLFEGAATSWASAHGLMQIIPQTGAQIAQALGWPPDYRTDDLYRPIVSVRFGSWYLAQQRDRFDGHLLVAIAAYNGGPSNAASWWEAADHDDGLFVELITLRETRRYVEAITEHLLKYRLLYIPQSP